MTLRGRLESWILAATARSEGPDNSPDRAVGFRRAHDQTPPPPNLQSHHPNLCRPGVIPVGCNNVDLVTFDPHDRYIECPASEIEDENRLILVELIESVGKPPRSAR